MKRILNVQSSIFGEDGASASLTRKLIERIQQTVVDVDVVTRDLSRDPLPHFSAQYIQALSAGEEERTEEQKALVAVGDQIIREVRSADLLIIAVPMYNFTLPSTLKSWFDYLARAGTTFRYTESGPEGLLKGRQAIIVTTRGGVYKGTPNDFAAPVAELLLNFVGIEVTDVIYAEGLNTKQRNDSLRLVEQRVEQYALAG